MHEMAGPRLAAWRNLLAAILYTAAVACLLFGLMGAFVATGIMARSTTGDVTGASMLMAFCEAWLAPLALAAALAAMQVRSPASHAPIEGRLGPDRRCMRALDRSAPGVRTVTVIGLLGAASLVAGVVARVNFTWASSRSPGAPSIPFARELANSVLGNLMLFGPLLLLALACASLAVRLLRVGRP